MKTVLLNRKFFSGTAFYIRMLIVAGLVCAVMLAWPPPVGAVLPPSDSAPSTSDQRDPVQLHCQKVVPKKVRSACQDEEMIKRTRNVASHHCTAEPSENNKKAKCIENKAKGYIDAAVKKNPKNEQDFYNKLDEVLKKAGGDPNKPSDDSTKSLTNPICSGGKCIDEAADPNADCSNGRCDLIKKYVNPLINLLSLCFGLIAAASLIAGGIQYSASVGDAQKVTNAKKRIFNTLLAVVAYIFMYSFLQFLVPGGLFNR